ncbi:MAG: GLUG motif-containing protein, partial [Planctomycetota bacterium]
NDYPRLAWENMPGEPITTPSYGGGGSGEPNDPYLIYTAEQLNVIGLFPCVVDKHFKLMADIDLSGYTGSSFNIIGSYSYPFTGVFNGNDHTISNFAYDSNETYYIGLFGYVDGLYAEIKNVGLRDPNVNGARGCIGSLVGFIFDGSITNCYSEGGSVAGLCANAVGGLVGRSDNGIITNCFSTASVSGSDDPPRRGVPWY